MELGKRHVVIVEGRDEDHVLAADVVDGVEATDLDVVGAVLELAPFRGVVKETLRVGCL